MVRCVFVKNDNNGWKCQTCDYIYWKNTIRPPIRLCVHTVKLPTGIISKGKRYLNERDIWKTAGKPYRSEEEIGRIFTEHCSPCEYFIKHSDKLGNCDICGCFLKVKSKSFNKIAWATTNCPATPPKWTAEIELPEEEKKELEQKMFQDQEEKQKNGLQMKDAVAHVTPPPVKRGGCGCNG